MESCEQSLMPFRGLLRTEEARGAEQTQKSERKTDAIRVDSSSRLALAVAEIENDRLARGLLAHRDSLHAQEAEAAQRLGGA